MATRKYKKQRKSNLKKKSLGKKKRSMKKRGKSLKKRGGGDDDDIYHIYEKHMDTTETSTNENVNVNDILNKHKSFITKSHGSCKINFYDRKNKLSFNIERKENCDKTKVLFYKKVLKDVLGHTEEIFETIYQMYDSNAEVAGGIALGITGIAGRFKKILIEYAKKLEKHAIEIVEQEKKKINKLTEQQIEEAITKELTEEAITKELTEVAITKELTKAGITKELTKAGIIKFKMEEPLLEFTNDKSFKYYDDNVEGNLQRVGSSNPEKKKMFQNQYMEKKDVYFHAFLVQIINLLNNEANLENVILIEYYKYRVNPLATNNRLTSIKEADE